MVSTYRGMKAVQPNPDRRNAGRGPFCALLGRAAAALLLLAAGFVVARAQTAPQRTYSETVTVYGNQYPGPAGAWSSGNPGVEITQVDGQPLVAGSELYFTYLSGCVSVGAGWPCTDAIGDTADGPAGLVGPFGSGFFEESYGDSSYYHGQLIVGDGVPGYEGGYGYGYGYYPLQFLTQGGPVYLGVEDDAYGDNTGSFTVQVTLILPQNGSPVFDGFGGSGPLSYLETAGWCVTDAADADCGPQGTRQIASPFRALGTYNLTEIDIAFEHSAGADNTATVQLVNDNNGFPGTKVLESWTQPLPTGPPGAAQLIAAFVSSGGVTLQSGQRYWVVLSDSGADSLDFVYDSAQTVTPGWIFGNFNGGPWTANTQIGTEMAFGVYGNPVGNPGPNSAIEPPAPLTSGDLVFPDQGLNGLLEVTPAGSLVQAIPMPGGYALNTGALQLSTALVRPSDHYIFLNARDSSGDPAVLELAPWGGLEVSQATCCGYLQQIAFDPSDPAQNTVIGGTPFSKSAIVAIDPYAHTVSQRVPEPLGGSGYLNNIIGLATDASGRIYASQWGSGTVYLFDKTGAPFGPYGVAGYPGYYDTNGISLGGGVLNVGEHSGDQVARLGPSGSSTTEYGLLDAMLSPLQAPLITLPDYVYADPENGLTYVGNENNGNVNVFDSGGNLVNTFTLPGSGIGTGAVVPAPCASVAASSFAVAQGGFRWLFTTGEMVQMVGVTNTSAAAVAGPISLVLGGLSPDAALNNASGAASSCTDLAGPYLDVVPAGGSLAPGGSVTVALHFADPTRAPITYTAAVVAGVGTR